MGTAFTPSRAKWADVERRHLVSFVLIIGMFVVLLVMSLAASWFAIDIVNGTRAYATGEGRYSKAEKVAVIALHTYAYSAAEGDYRRFLQELRIPLGDHVGREALERPSPDLKQAASGFLAGANNPSDIAGLIRLFRWFSRWGPFAEAVSDWRKGDRLVLDLQTVGADLHRRVGARSLDVASRWALLGRLDRIDDQMTKLENRFSAHMGDAARSATWLVIIGVGATMVVLWAIGIGFAATLLRRQLQLDRQLTSSERRFRDFAEVGSDWYWEMDPADRIEYMSDQFLQILRLGPADVIGKNGGDFIRNNVVSVHDREVYDLAVAHQEPFRNVRVRAQSPDGAALYWSISGKARIDAAGQYKGYRGVASDITAQVRDAQIMQESKERAEVASRAKSEFLANMSHELRTPLNAILGFSEVIAARLLGEQGAHRYSEYAKDIHASGTHLLSIINDILDLSKVEAGHGELKESEESLADICRSLHPLLDTRLAASGVVFSMSLPTPDPIIRVDRRKLIQVLVNLLSNAAKFTPQGGRVSLGACYFPSGGLAITVSDTGIGIAPENIEAALQPFGQVESVFSRQHHGTGLGLPLARALIELHGGMLSIESEPDHGTEVTIVLPPERLVAATRAFQRKTASG